MRIGIAVRELNIRGGTHKQVQRLAEHLVRAGETVRIYTKYFDPDRCYPGIGDLDVRPVTPLKTQVDERGKRSRHRWESSVALGRALARECDVVNLHDNGLKLAWLVAKLLNPRLRFVWQINDLPASFGVGATPAAKRPRLKQRWRDLVDRLTARLMARSVDAITVNVTKNAHRVRDHLGVEAKVLHCGVDLRNAAPVVRAPPAPGPLRIVSTGVFLPYRNYEAILHAQARLRDRHGITSSLRIVGSTGPAPGYARSVADLAAELGVACEILGEVDEPTLAEVYRSSDVFVFVNVDQSWGLAVFEAMDFGLPVVVSRSVGATELLHPGADAEVVDPQDPGAIADALAALHRDPELYRRRSEAAFTATRGMVWGELYGEPMRRELRRVAGAAA